MNFELAERKDLMSHENIVLNADVSITRYDIKGKQDRRFKSGRRILPSSGINVIVNYIMVERREQFKLNQMWNVGKFDSPYNLGTFAVVEMTSESVKLIPASLSQNKDRYNFKIGKTDLLYMGSFYMEGSI